MAIQLKLHQNFWNASFSADVYKAIGKNCSPSTCAPERPCEACQKNALHLLEEAWRLKDNPCLAESPFSKCFASKGCCHLHIAQNFPIKKWKQLCSNVDKEYRNLFLFKPENDMAHEEALRLMKKSWEVDAKPLCSVDSNPVLDVKTDSEISLVVDHIAKCFEKAHQGKRLRPVQRIAISVNLSSYKNEDNALSEMKTGEGKTYVCAGIASGIRKLESARVVFLLSSSVDRSEADLEEARTFIKECTGVEPVLACNFDWKTGAPTVVYGTTTELERVYVDVLQRRDKVSHQKFFDFLSSSAILIDEVDHVLIEQAENQLYISTPCMGMRALQPMMFLATAFADFAADFGVKKVKNLAAVPDAAGKLAKKLLEELDNIIVGQGQMGRWKLLAPSVVDRNARAGNAASGVLIGRLKRNDVDYVLEKKIDDQTGEELVEVTIVDGATGTESYGTRWTAEAPFVEAHNGLPIGSSDPLAYFCSIVTLVKKAHWFGGLTGTLGGSAHLSYYKKAYNVQSVVRIPKNVRSVMYQLAPNIANSRETWLTNIVDTVKKYHKKELGLGVTGPSLIIMENIKDAKELVELFCKQGCRMVSNENRTWACEQLLSNLHIFSYYRSSHALNEKQTDNNVIVATSKGGRGLDLKVDGNALPCCCRESSSPLLKSNSVLFVVLTKVLPERQDVQARGRCGRCGTPGVFQYQILNDSVAISKSPINFVMQEWKDHGDVERNDLTGKATRVSSMRWQGSVLEDFSKEQSTVISRWLELLQTKGHPEEVSNMLHQFISDVIIERWGYWREMGEGKRSKDDDADAFFSFMKLQLPASLNSTAGGTAQSKIEALVERLLNFCAAVGLDAEGLYALGMAFLRLPHDEYRSEALHFLQRAASGDIEWKAYDGDDLPMEWTGNAAILLAAVRRRFGLENAEQARDQAIAVLGWHLTFWEAVLNRCKNIAQPADANPPRPVTQEEIVTHKWYFCQMEEMVYQLKQRKESLSKWDFVLRNPMEACFGSTLLMHMLGKDVAKALFEHKLSPYPIEQSSNKLFAEWVKFYKGVRSGLPRSDGNKSSVGSGGNTELKTTTENRSSEADLSYLWNSDARAFVEKELSRWQAANQSSLKANIVASSWFTSASESRKKTLKRFQKRSGACVRDMRSSVQSRATDASVSKDEEIASLVGDRKVLDWINRQAAKQLMKDVTSSTSKEAKTEAFAAALKTALAGSFISLVDAIKAPKDESSYAGANYDRDNINHSGSGPKVSRDEAKKIAEEESKKKTHEFDPSMSDADRYLLSGFEHGVDEVVTSGAFKDQGFVEQWRQHQEAKSRYNDLILKDAVDEETATATKKAFFAIQRAMLGQVKELLEEDPSHLKSLLPSAFATHLDNYLCVTDPSFLAQLVGCSIETVKKAIAGVMEITKVVAKNVVKVVKKVVEPVVRVVKSGASTLWGWVKSGMQAIGLGRYAERIERETTRVVEKTVETVKEVVSENSKWACEFLAKAKMSFAKWAAEAAKWAARKARNISAHLSMSLSSVFTVLLHIIDILKRFMSSITMKLEAFVKEMWKQSKVLCVLVAMLMSYVGSLVLGIPGLLIAFAGALMYSIYSYVRVKADFERFLRWGNSEYLNRDFGLLARGSTRVGLRRRQAYQRVDQAGWFQWFMDPSLRLGLDLHEDERVQEAQDRANADYLRENQWLSDFFRFAIAIFGVVITAMSALLAAFSGFTNILAYALLSLVAALAELSLEIYQHLVSNDATLTQEQKDETLSKITVAQLGLSLVTMWAVVKDLGLSMAVRVSATIKAVEAASGIGWIIARAIRFFQKILKADHHLRLLSLNGATTYQAGATTFWKTMALLANALTAFASFVKSVMKSRKQSTVVQSNQIKSTLILRDGTIVEISDSHSSLSSTKNENQNSRIGKKKQIRYTPHRGTPVVVEFSDCKLVFSRKLTPEEKAIFAERESADDLQKVFDELSAKPGTTTQKTADFTRSITYNGNGQKSATTSKSDSDNILRTKKERGAFHFCGSSPKGSFSITCNEENLVVDDKDGLLRRLIDESTPHLENIITDEQGLPTLEEWEKNPDLKPSSHSEIKRRIQIMLYQKARDEGKSAAEAKKAIEGAALQNRIEEFASGKVNDGADHHAPLEALLCDYFGLSDLQDNQCVLEKYNDFVRRYGHHEATWRIILYARKLMESGNAQEAANAAESSTSLSTLYDALTERLNLEADRSRETRRFLKKAMKKNNMEPSLYRVVDLVSELRRRISENIKDPEELIKVVEEFIKKSERDPPLWANGMLEEYNILLVEQSERIASYAKRLAEDVASGASKANVDSRREELLSEMQSFVGNIDVVKTVDREQLVSSIADVCELRADSHALSQVMRSTGQTAEQAAGFFTERYVANTFNADAILKGSPLRAIVNPIRNSSNKGLMQRSYENSDVYIVNIETGEVLSGAEIKNAKDAGSQLDEKYYKPSEDMPNFQRIGPSDVSLKSGQSKTMQAKCPKTGKEISSEAYERQNMVDTCANRTDRIGQADIFKLVDGARREDWRKVFEAKNRKMIASGVDPKTILKELNGSETGNVHQQAAFYKDTVVTTHEQKKTILADGAQVKLVTVQTRTESENSYSSCKTTFVVWTDPGGNSMELRLVDDQLSSDKPLTAEQKAAFGSVKRETGLGGAFKKLSKGKGTTLTATVVRKKGQFHVESMTTFSNAELNLKWDGSRIVSKKDAGDASQDLERFIEMVKRASAP